MSYCSQTELAMFGFKKLGDNVRLSKKASVYNAANIEIGDHSRIDDFCVLSAGEGGLVIGCHVHIAVYSSIIGKERIELSDYANVSSRVSIYSSSDDYSGEYMSNPTIPAQFTNVMHRPVVIGKHVIIGAGTVVLPGVVVSEGAAIGALSLVKNDCEPFTMYAGVPVRKIGPRSRQLLKHEQSLKLFEKSHQ